VLSRLLPFSRLLFEGIEYISFLNEERTKQDDNLKGFPSVAIMDLSDQELCVALEEFERTMFDVSDLFILEKPFRQL